MSIEKELAARSKSCELCTNAEHVQVLLVAPKKEQNTNTCIMACKICTEQIDGIAELNANHWRCLNESIWSEVPAVKVLAWRMLHRLKNEDWSQDLLDMIYLEEDQLEWAKATGEGPVDENAVIHKDSNGVVLEAGDTVVLIKDLNVKGTSFIAKRGTSVRRISLDHDNANHIEGKVNDQRIVILTQYVKKMK